MTGENYNYLIINDGLEIYRNTSDGKIVDAFVSFKIIFKKFYPGLNFACCGKIEISGNFLMFSEYGGVNLNRIKLEFVNCKIIKMEDKIVSIRDQKIDKKTIMKKFIEKFPSVENDILFHFDKKLYVDGNTLTYEVDGTKFRLDEHDIVNRSSIQIRDIVWISAIKPDGKVTCLTSDGKIHHDIICPLGVTPEVIFEARKKHRVFLSNGNLISALGTENSSDILKNSILIYDHAELISFKKGTIYIVTPLSGNENDLKNYINIHIPDSEIIGLGKKLIVTVPRSEMNNTV